MLIRLAKSELLPMTEQRLVRMRNDITALRQLPTAEARAAYDVIEAMRDALSGILDRVDGKHV